MARTPPARPDGRRRKPRQSRSHLTVASILEATERLAARDGFHRLETARIAAAAGISIGSLYQYFANLEAIVLALYEERTAEVAHTMKAAMVAILDQPPARALPGVMDLILRLHEKHRLIVHQLATEMPQLKLRAHPASVDRLTHGSVVHYLRHRHPAMTPAERQRKAFFLERVVLGCVRSYLDDPADVPRAAFVRDLTTICVRYLEG
jgi:AcrR family transcriptional regulator